MKQCKGLQVAPPILLCILVLLVSTDARQCQLTCTGGSGNILKFQPGKTYQYKLEGSSITTLPGAKNDVSKVGIEANVEVSAATDCEHVLTVSGVKTIAPDGKSYSVDSTVATNLLKFGLRNGKIFDLCASQTETSNALNVKRAVLSLLQSTVLKDSGYVLQHETDVFGNCPTNFEFSKQGGSVIVKKSKDLIKCTHREELNLPFSTSSYFVKSDIQTSPLLLGTYSSEQKFDGGILKSAQSEEQYSYNPMSTVESATKIRVLTKLSLVGQTDKPCPVANVNNGKSLIFEGGHPGDYKGGVETMVELLKGSCHTRSIEQDGASKYNKLVRTVADAPKADLLKVYQQVKTGQGFKEPDVAKKMFMDSLADAGSSSSVEVLAEILKNKEVTGGKAAYYHMLLGSIKHATKEALLAVLPLIDDSASTDLYLGAGALGGRFCREHNCANFPEVEAFQLKLAAPLLTKGCKPASKKEEDILIASLKGLANMRFLTKPIVKKIVDNVADSSVKSRIRAALLDTIRSDANKPEFKTTAGEIFKNPEEDSEIRIKAYLALAECPCGKVASLVKSVLENEKSFQVGGFVVSHLRNLRASTNPEKASARHHLGGIIHTPKFPIDPRKYSLNNELSYSVDMLNVGAAGESNVIFSQKSYIPRSVSLNLTSYMFGHAFNWLEIDLRSENLEKAIEKLLGPRGKLRKNKINEVYDDVREEATEQLEKVAERYEETLRPKRSITRNQLDALANKVNLHQEEDEIDIDLSLKMHGAERLWVRYHSNEDKIDSDRIIDYVFSSTDEALKSAKNLKFDYRKHFTFLEREVIYPTGLGLPLKVKAIGSNAYRVKVDGKIDLPALLKDPKNSDVRLQVIPSAAIELRGDIVLGAIAFEGGVKVTLNVHSSTGSDVTFRVIDGHGVDVKFGLPIKKQDIISINSDVTTIIRHDNLPEKNIPIAFDVKREKYSGCFDQLNDVLGITVCGEVDVPWEGPRSLSAAYGPSKLSLHVDKDDDSLTIYHFKVIADDSEGVKKFEVLFDTPNSRVDRKMRLLLEGSLGEKKYGIISLKSPWTNVLLESALVFTQKELSLNAKFIHDDVEYAFKTGAAKTVNGNVARFEPILEYKAPEQAKNALVGRRGGPKPSAQVVTVSGALVVVTDDKGGSSWKYEDLSINTPRTKYTIKGTGKATKNSAEIDYIVSYDKESVVIKGQFKENKLNARDSKINTQLSILPSQYPDSSLNIKWDILNVIEQKYESTLSVIHGPDPNSATNKVYLHNAVEVNKKEGIYATDNVVTYPLVNLDLRAGGRVAPKSFKTDLKGQFDRYSAQVLAKVDYNTKKDGDYNAELKWELMGNSLALTMSRNVLKAHQSKFANVLEITPGGRYELNANVKHKIGQEEIDLSSDIDLILPADPKNIKIKAMLKNNEVETKAQLNAAAGSKQYLKTELNLKTGDKPSGNFKVNILEHLNANGDFIYDGANVKAKTKIDLPKAQRQMDGKANLAVSKSKVAGSVDFCWDTKSPEKTMKLTTDTSLLENSVDSKNSLTIGGKKTIVNLKGSTTGEEEKGSCSGEVELILSSGERIKLKGNDKHDLANEKNMNGEGYIELEVQSPKEGTKSVAIKMVGKNIDLENQNFEGLVELILGKNQQKTSAFAKLKKVPKGKDRTTLKGELNLNAFIDPELVIKIDAEVPTELLDDDLSISKELDTLPAINYHVTVSGGPDIQIQANGKIGGNIANAELTAKLPSNAKINSLKLSTNNIIDLDIPNSNKRKIKSNNELHWNGDQFVKVSGEANCEGNGFTYSSEWESNKMPKRKLTGSAHWSEDANSAKADANAALSWEGKNADVSLKVEKNSDNYGSIHLLGSTPEQGKFDLLLKNKVVSNGEGIHSDIVLTTKDKKVSVSSKIETNKDHPMVDIVVDHPGGKSRLLVKLDHKGERHWASEIKAKWTGDRSGNINIDSELYLNSVENFFMKHNIDAPQAGVKKLLVELSNKPGRSDGKKITFTIKEEDKIVISANSNYVIKRDGNENIIEGNGNLKMREEQFPLNFKGTWIDTEDQKAAKLQIKSLKKTIYVEFKRTDDEINIERKMCHEDECSKAQFLNRVRSSGLDDYDHTLVLLLDLSVFKRDGLKDIYYGGSYKRKGQTVDHLVEAKYGGETKFKYNGYIHDKESGLLISLPKRTVGADLIYDINTNKDKKSGSVKLEANLYINKDTNDKLCFISNSNVETTQDNIKISSETKLTHPTLRKDLAVRGNVFATQLMNDIKGEIVIDVFKHDDQKIVIDFKSTSNEKPYKTSSVVNIRSASCKLDIKYENLATIGDDGAIYYSDKITYLDNLGAAKTSAVVFELNPKKAYFLVKLPQGKLIEADAKVNVNEKELKILADYQFGSLKYKESLNYNRQNNHAVYQLKWADHTIDCELGILLTKSAQISVKLDNKDCAHLTVALDKENFLKSDYNYDPEVVKNTVQLFGEIIEEEGEQIAIGLKKNFDKEKDQASHFAKCLTECVPDFTALSNHIKKEATSLKDAALEDADVSNAVDQLKEGFGTLFDQLTVIINEISKLAQTVGEFIAEISNKSSEVLKEFWPKLSNALDKFGKSLNSLVEQYIKVLMQVFNEFVDHLKKYKDDVDAFLSVYSEVIHEIGKQFSSIIYILHDEVQKFIQINIEQLQELPITNMLKEKYEELKELRIPEEALMVYQEIVDNLKQFLPTPECEDFVTALSEYITKVLKQEDVDSAEAAKEIYSKLMNAIQSLIAKVNELSPKRDTFKPEKYVTLPITSWIRLPAGSIRVSLINLLRSQDLPIILGSLESFALSLNPLKNIPPFEGIAQIIDGTEIITFDNRHYHVKGMCSYVLAEDYENRNFSVVGHFKNGKLEAITAWDENHSITLRKDGAPLKDGLEAEYPLKVGLLKAWKSPETVGLRSKAGLIIHCTPNVDSCTFIVSGFYFNRLRGLLGNLNYEQYDDLALPQGNVGSNPEQLCNSWKVDNACPDIPIAPHAHKRQRICTDMFASDDSDLILGRPWLQLAPYRDACDHLVEEASGNKEKVACNVAAHYVLHAQMKGASLLEIPSECVICDINGKKVNELEDIEITPGKAADIVFLVDVNKRNEHVYKGLVQPLVPQLKAQLAKEQINDVRIVLASYNSPSLKWTNYHTVQGKLEFGGADCQIHFEEMPQPNNSTWLERLIDGMNKLEQSIGSTSQMKGLEQVLNTFNFRPQALKSIISVHGEACETESQLHLIAPIRALTNAFLAKDAGVVWNIITPINSLATDAKAGIISNDITCFSSGEMYTVDKTVEGDADYETDYCIPGALSTGGVIVPAINFMDRYRGGPAKTAPFIQKTAERLVLALKEHGKQPLQCDCGLLHGLIPKPECSLEMF